MSWSFKHKQRHMCKKIMENVRNTQLKWFLILFNVKDITLYEYFSIDKPI